MDAERLKKLVNALIITLNASSSLLVLGSLFLIQIFSVLYGVGNGLQVLSQYSNAAVPAGLQGLVSQNMYLHDSILESYVLTVIAIMMLETSFMLFLRRNERSMGGARKYVAMHTGFTVIYALIFSIVYMDSAQYLGEIYLWAIYMGMVLSLAAGIAANYAMRMPIARESAIRRSIKVDPNRPFSNMVELQDKIFSNLKGHLMVVDKHFNSSALGNFHRLMIDNIMNFSQITVITSTDMMDANFGKNISDFKKELEHNKVSFEVRFMDEMDKVAQHERMMLDDAVAYKIPPFNIINRRSEHIMLIGHSESKKRFEYLYGRAISMENFSLKQGRNGLQEQRPDE